MRMLTVYASVLMAGFASGLIGGGFCLPIALLSLSFILIINSSTIAIIKAIQEKE